MNFVYRLSLSFAGIWLLAVSSLAIAQASPDSQKAASPPDTKPASGVEKKLEQPDSGTAPAAVRHAKPGYGRAASIDRRLAALARLQDQVLDKIKVSPDQRKKIQSIFDDYMGGLINSNYMPHAQPKPEDMTPPQELPRLKKELVEAEKDGQDKDKIASIQAKINAARIALEPCVVDEPNFFLEYVRQELAEDQRSEYEALINRWLMLRPPDVAPDDDFKRVRRATRDPELRDTKELAKKLDDLIVEAIRTVPLGPKRVDPEVMKNLAEATKPKVLELLTPAQREHFEKTLEMLKRRHEEDPELAKRARERLKDHRPSVTFEQEAQAPPSGTGAKP